MIISDVNKNRFNRLLSYLVAFFCFILFPSFVIDVGLKNYYEQQLQNYKNKQFELLNNQLDYLDEYSDNDKYFSSLLTKIFDKASHSKDPIKKISFSINKLKNNYGNKIKFIVWSGNGKIVKNLTDIKKFRYVMKKLFEVLHAVWLNESQEVPGPIKSIAGIKSKLNIVKNFIGKIFIPESLKAPYSKGADKKMALINISDKNSYCWYHINERIGVFCFLNRTLIRKYSGIKKIVDVLNAQNTKIKYGFAKITDPLTPYYPSSNSIKADISFALGKFENSSEPFTETENALFVIRTLNNRLRGFAFIKKQAEKYNINRKKNALLFKILISYIGGFFLLILFSKYRLRFVSIKWKLILLFLYANLIPLTILGFITHNYLILRKISIISEIKKYSISALENFDARYTTTEYTVENKLNNIIAKINTDFSNEKFRLKDSKLLKQTLKQYEYDECYLIASSGRSFFALNHYGKHIGHSYDYLKQMARDMLKILNNGYEYKKSSMLITDSFVVNSKVAMGDNIRSLGKIWSMQFNNSSKLTYWNSLGKSNGTKNYMLFVLWKSASLQKRYIATELAHPKILSSGLEITAKWIYSKNLYYKDTFHNEDFNKFITRVIKRKKYFLEDIRINNNKYILSGKLGDRLKYIILIAKYPLNNVTKVISRLRTKIFLGILISLFLVTLIGILLSNQFLKPLSEFGEAAKSIRNRNFDYKTLINGNDEFGRLGQILNRVMDGLKDFEVAKIVQRDLFPPSRLTRMPFRIYGKSVVMTVLGGDYFDYVNLGPKKFGIVMGDVSGHGIPAGLIMAMAKAGVELADESVRTDPAELMKQLHTIIYTLKNKKLKRMMTCQYLVVEQDSENITLSNAGHCFPLIVNHKSKSTRYVESIGGPLGIMRRPRYSNQDFQLGRGDSLILYTDGIVEAKDKNGESLGFDGFEKMVLECYNHDPEVFYNSLYAAHISRTAEIDDDMTIIVINKTL